MHCSGHAAASFAAQCHLAGSHIVAHYCRAVDLLPQDDAGLAVQPRAQNAVPLPAHPASAHPAAAVWAAAVAAAVAVVAAVTAAAVAAAVTAAAAAVAAVTAAAVDAVTAAAVWAAAAADLADVVVPGFGAAKPGSS